MAYCSGFTSLTKNSDCTSSNTPCAIHWLNNLYHGTAQSAAILRIKLEWHVRPSNEWRNTADNNFPPRKLDVPTPSDDIARVRKLRPYLINCVGKFDLNSISSFTTPPSTKLSSSLVVMAVLLEFQTRKFDIVIFRLIPVACRVLLVWHSQSLSLADVIEKVRDEAPRGRLLMP